VRRKRWSESVKKVLTMRMWHVILIERFSERVKGKKKVWKKRKKFLTSGWW